MTNPRVVAITVPVINTDGEPVSPGDSDMDTDDMQAYIARVSNPETQLVQTLESAARLLNRCAEKRHWSVFEAAYCTIELETPIPIAMQLIRHRSFTAQQFSARYADVSGLGFADIEPRRQDTKNRQNSTADLDEVDYYWFKEQMAKLQAQALQVYQGALARGIAKESARFALPQSQTTRLYLTGNVRSWVTYFQVRAYGEGVQSEHRELALAMAEAFKVYFPITWPAFFDQED